MSDAKAASPRADSKAGANTKTTATTTTTTNSISAGGASARGTSGVGQAEAKVSARGSARVDYNNDSKDGAAPPQQGSARVSARER